MLVRWGLGPYEKDAESSACRLSSPCGDAGEGGPREPAGGAVTGSCTCRPLT